MNLKAKERQTGVYGTVNAGDIVTVSDSLGAELIAVGSFEETSEEAPLATPEEVSEHNESGLTDEPIQTDGTDREILNTDGRKLHESGELANAEAQARVEAGVTADLNQEPISDGDDVTTPAAKAKKK